MLLAIFSVACNSHSLSKKVIVLGVDGMDPRFVEQHWSALPNLDRLRKQGGFRHLQTTDPPQSPVAWSTFITGMDPAGHGIYDFVERDPVTLQPFSSMSETEPPKWTLTLGSYSLPLSSAHVRSRRKGRAFWELLAEHHIPVTVIRMPTNYPPLKAGEALSGMGTPDLRGTLGTFTFYTDSSDEISRTVSGGRIVKVPAFRNRAVLHVEGPPNSLRKGQPFTYVDLTVDIDPVAPVARLQAQDSVAVVKQGEWSDWLRADFPLLPHLISATGMFRVYAKQLHPTLELYVSAINLDPRSPELPISAPTAYSRAIASDVGPFYTQGIAEDTAALRQGVFDLPEYLSQSQLVFNDERNLLRRSLRHFQSGFLFCYFSVIDQNSHMLWGKHETELLATYNAVDGVIGEVMRQEGEADLIVMSDHGFSTFDRAVNLNTWLASQGWQNQAYAIGLNALYLSRAGRKEHGLLAQIEAQLLAFRDPANGRQVVEAVHRLPASPLAPDLIVGYAPGYRASWQTALGEAPEAILEDNVDAWIADHCINSADVPGVLFSNRNISAKTPSLKDVTVSILHLFGVGPGAGMSGTPAL